VISEIEGVRVGHVTNDEAKTGCTVVVLPEGNTTSGEVRGGSPATREFDLLHPSRRVEGIDALVLSGGSAFGLASCDGVATWLEEQGRGFQTAVGKVPIVVGLSLFDLAVGSASIRPTAEDGYRAAANSSANIVGGQIGAGTGATVGKWRGREQAQPGGIGVATLRSNSLIVSALIAVNAFGFIDDGSTTIDIGPPTMTKSADNAFGNTTIGIILTNAHLTKKDCFLVAQSGHDGLARALLPAHTEADGDALVVSSCGTIEADFFHVRLLAQQVVTTAIRSVGAATRHSN
jgi:L-aminopeptidase/D-esterase-like protein